MKGKRLTSVLCAFAMVLALLAPGGISTTVSAVENTRWKGMKVSVLGDSISTYKGWSNNHEHNATISGNLVFFPKPDANFDVNGTWWKQIIDHTGMELLVNNSFSGDELNPNKSPGKGLYRCVELHDNNGVKPDVIFIHFGTNDAGNEDSVDVFRTNYKAMMSKIAGTYPDAEVFFFTLLPRFNITVPPYSAVIRELVTASGNSKFHLVDIEKDSGITLDNLQQYTMDNLHPNDKGMDLITNTALAVMGVRPLDVTPSVSGHTHSCAHDHADKDAVWMSLNDAVAAENGGNKALSNGYYYLEEDLTLTGSQCLLVQGARMTTLCLNGHSLKAGRAATYLFSFGANDYTPKCTLNVCDCAGTGTIGGLKDGTNFYNGVFSVNKGGTLNLYGGTITGSKTANTVCVIGEATFNMYGGRIVNNENTLNGAVYVKGGTFNLYGGEIAGNKVPAGDQVTGIYNKRGGTVADVWSGAGAEVTPEPPTETPAEPDTDLPGAKSMLDVPADTWYYSAVDYVVQNGIMSGYNATTFGPSDTLSRAMVVQVLYNKEGQPTLDGAKHSFTDVPSDQWFNNAVTWGSQKGVVSGFGDGKFRPNDYVTVEQVAVILHNYSGKPACPGEPSGVGEYDGWAKEALNWAATQGILKDVPFANATENATRAQTAQILKNFLTK